MEGEAHTQTHMSTHCYTANDVTYNQTRMHPAARTGTRCNTRTLRVLQP